MKPQMSMVALLGNFIAFQAGWLACVLGAARGRVGLGVLVALLIVVVQLLLNPRPLRLLQLIGLTALLGLIWDTLPPALGLMQYPASTWPAPVAPVWIVVMWMLFATTLGGVLRSLQQRLWLAALVGAAGAPLAYYGGARLGALTLTRPLPALLAEAVGWALLLPLLLVAARRLDV
ncbi:MAG TPA: DUF2878 domain-containing protein [Steroidobacteraceae bacterium]